MQIPVIAKNAHGNVGRLVLQSAGIEISSDKNDTAITA